MPRIGLVDGRLAPCPQSPNCVSSQADPQDAQHYVAPITAPGDPERVQAAVRAVVTRSKRTRIVDDRPGYLHATYTSALFRFVDDVEFLLAPDAGLIHVRSASRVGYSDLGANRKRVEDIRRRYAQVAAAGVSATTDP